MSVPTQIPTQLTPLQRLVGPQMDRRVAANELRFALAETAAGGSKLAMLVGEPGSGKTRQAHDVLPWVNQRGGMLIESRIESLNWSNPLDSLLLGLSQLSLPLTKQLSNPSLSGQDALLELGRRLGLIQDVHGDRLDLSLALQLQLLVGEVLEVACQQLKPLVWIIDDVDLLDQDALAVLDHIIEHRPVPYLMLLLCVRNEMQPEIMRWQQQARCQVFRLEPFSIKDTVTWLIDEQNLNPILAAGIAPFLQQTCQGNLQLCRFLLDSLAAHDLLGAVPENQWPQRIQQISLQLRAPEAELYFREQLLSLPETGLELLQSASLIGMEFDARLLHDYLPEKAIQEHLILAQQQGLVEVLAGYMWRFVHPHLQRLAQQTVEPQHLTELHGRLAQRMMKHSTLALQGLRHAALARQMLTAKDRIRLAELGVAAAEQAIVQASPLHAGQILMQVLVLMGDELWLEQASLSEKIIELWCSTLQEPAHYADLQHLQAHVPPQANQRVVLILAACQLRLSLLMHNYEQAFIAAETALLQLGEPLSMRGGRWQTLRSLVAWLWARTIKAPKTTPCQLARVNAAQDILADLFGPCFFARPQLLIAVTLKQLTLIIKHGASPASASGQICGALLLTALSRYRAAFELADDARQVARMMLGHRQRHRVPILDLGFIQPWQQNVQQLLPDIWRWQQNAQVQGDFEYAGYAHMFYLGHSIFSGSPLIHLQKEASKIEDDLRQTRQQHLLPMSATFRQFLRQMVVPSAQPWRLIGAHCDENMLGDLYQRGDQTNIFNYYLSASYIAMFCHAGDAARPLLELARPHASAVKGSIIAALYCYLSALNRCGDGKIGLWQRWRIRRDLRQMQDWAKINPLHFASKAALLQAEFLRVQGHDEQAQACYLNAIELARQQWHHHECAMAELYYARFLMQRQQFHHARLHLRQAIEQYEIWGASAVVTYLHREFDGFLK